MWINLDQSRTGFYLGYSGLIETPHDSTREKPSFLLFGIDSRSPTDAALIPPQDSQATGTEDISDYREELGREPNILFARHRNAIKLNMIRGPMM